MSIKVAVGVRTAAGHELKHKVAMSKVGDAITDKPIVKEYLGGGDKTSSS